jgi:hypothetical protein
MAHGIKFAEGLQVCHLKTPAVLAADGESAWVKLENMQWISFLVSIGTITNTTDNIIFYVQSTTSATSGTTNANDTAIPFWYRLSSAVSDDNWGDITQVSTGTDGYTLTGASDDRLVIIDVDPAYIPSRDSDADYVYLDMDITLTSTDTGPIVSIVGVFEPRYPQVEQLSSS